MSFSPEQLEMQPPGAILEWRIFDDGFIADDYRIVLLGPAAWEVRRSGRQVGVYRRLRTAFVTAEHDYRESLRLGALRRHGSILGLSILAWLTIDVIFGLTDSSMWALALFPVVFVGMRSLVRTLAALPGNVHPHVVLPRDHRRRWRRRRW